MKLWKKESNDSDAFYVDIFAEASDLEFCAQNYAEVQRRFGVTIENKCDRLSLAYRNDGNTLFGEGKWVAAIEKYNDSLRFAKTGSPNISFAFANRCACFLRLQMYEECLIDIESAKKSQYPEHLMYKLEQRKRDCFTGREALVSGPVNDIGRKLSFEADENFPCMANVLQINSGEGHFSIVAMDDIGVGQTIVMEPSFTSYLYMHHGHKCNICLKERSNLYPCKVCTIGMFCSKECEQLHDVECNLKFCDHNQTNGQILEGVRLIFSVINQFPDVSALIGFVEEQVLVEHNDRKELPVSLADFRSNYRTFLKLPVSLEFEKSGNFLVMTYCTYTFILTIPKVSEWFPSPMHRRFLVQLIGHHMMILENNAIRIRYLDKKTNAFSYMGLMNQFFEHSCAPNVFNSEYNGHNTFVTVRPIKKGDRLHISYVDPRGYKTERQLELRKKYQIDCKCMRCNDISSATTAQRKEISSDPDFKAIIGFNINDLHVAGADKAQKMIGKCVASFEKYENILWCSEIEQLLDMFIRVLRVYFSTPLPYTIEELVMNRFKNLTY